MMAKLTLSNLVSLENQNSAINTVNNNNAALTTAFENTLSRDGTTPNFMTSQLDMNSNRILNLPAPVSGAEPLRLQDVTGLSVVVNTTSVVFSTRVAAIISTIGSSVQAIQTGGYATSGDGGHGLYARSNTLLAGGFTSADGAHWNLTNSELNVKQFGAVGNGTVNDTTAIQTALTAAYAFSTQATGGIDRGTVVYFPYGTYKVTAPLVVQGETLLRGSGRDTSIILNYSPNTDLFQVGLNTAFEDLGLYGSGYGNLASPILPTAGWGITSTNALSAPEGCRVSNCVISDFYQGIDFSRGSNCIVEFCKVRNIYGPVGVQNVGYITNNQLDMTFFGGVPDNTSGFTQWAGTTAVTVGQVRWNNVGGGGWFYCTKAGTTGTTLSGGPSPAIFASTIVDGTAHWVFQCQLGLAMVNLPSGLNGAWILGNDIAGPMSYCIQCASGGHTIVGNNMAQSQGIGIRLLTGSNLMVVSNNVFTQMFGSSSVGGSVITGDTVTEIIFNGNSINSSLQPSIKFVSSTYITINNNNMNGPYTGSAITFISCNKFTVIGNTIKSDGSSAAVTNTTPAGDVYIISNNIVDGATVTGATGGAVVANNL